ncbi:MAG: 2'-5' RNA ligase family protein [Shinella sp.]|nr:2'-5' RNA ligase family protein [Shinella sp.]
MEFRMAIGSQYEFDFSEEGHSRHGKCAPRGHSNLFLAIVPDREAARRSAGIAADLNRRHALLGRLRPQAMMHVTMRSLGSYDVVPEELLFAISAAMPAVTATAFEIVLDHAMSFQNRRKKPLVLCSSLPLHPLFELRECLIDAMRAAGIKSRGEKKFTPHMTLFYPRESLPRTPIEQPLVWTAREFVLVQSVVGKSRHLRLDRWPLLG